MDAAGDYLQFKLHGSDAAVTRRVCAAMRDIVRASIAPGFAHEYQMDAIYNACFDDYSEVMTVEQNAAIIVNFVRKNIRYQPDPEETEYIQYPHVVYREGYGDCDDMTVLVCALAAMRNLPRIQVQAIKYAGRPYYSHVYAVIDGFICDACLKENEEPIFKKGDQYITLGI